MQRWKPHVTVAAVVERDGRFLMVREHTVDGIRVNQPAGHLEQGESLPEAVMREALEETGWKVRPEALLGIYQATSSDASITYLRFAFLCRPLAEQPGHTLDEGIIEALWLTRDEIAALERTGSLRGPAVMRCVDDCLAGERHPIGLVRTLP
jgi:phosphatase NudJ